MKQQETLWNYTWHFLIKTFGLSVSIPWLLLSLFHLLQQRWRKASLKGKVVMITGASSGLGEALAHVFYSCGCRIILVSRRKVELEKVKSALMSKHSTVPTYPPIVLPLDLTNINDLQSEVTKVLSIHGRIDILINNAGMSYRGQVVNTKIDVDIKLMLINYFAQIALAKAVLPSMIKQNCGHIVCISSIQGKIGIPYRSAYAASKHALQAWCDAARAELADQHIRLTVISPGYIRTNLSLNALTESGGTYGVMDKTTQEGYTPADVAKQVLKAVINEKKDVIIASLGPKCAVALRTLCPPLFFWIMKKRARKSMKEE